MNNNDIYSTNNNLNSTNGTQGMTTNETTQSFNGYTNYASNVQPTEIAQSVNNYQSNYTGSVNNVNGSVPTSNVQNNSMNQNAVNPMAAMSNLNKEEAMEEALSHTNQYTPFEVPKQEVLDAQKKESNKSAYIFIVVIAIIMALFILFLPQISKMFGW